mmetsp:Transcript_5755/g.11810  ORF Transcript_5755/g.11810 Transcript_5755/m.11810 type:complete len:205 (-) Transcript_5755:671-1285(-)
MGTTVQQYRMCWYLRKMHGGAGKFSMRLASASNIGPYFPHCASSNATSSKPEIKFTAVKFRIMSMTSEVVITKSRTTTEARIPCEKRIKHDNIIISILSSFLTFFIFGHISTAVTVSLILSLANTQYAIKDRYWVAPDRVSTFDGMKVEKNPSAGLSLSSFVLSFKCATRKTSKMRKTIWNTQTKTPNRKKVGFSKGRWSAIKE